MALRERSSSSTCICAPCVDVCVRACVRMARRLPVTAESLQSAQARLAQEQRVALGEGVRRPPRLQIGRGREGEGMVRERKGVEERSGDRSGCQARSGQFECSATG